MKKVLQMLFSIFSTVSLMISAIPSEASEKYCYGGYRPDAVYACLLTGNSRSTYDESNSLYDIYSSKEAEHKIAIFEVIHEKDLDTLRFKNTLSGKFLSFYDNFGEPCRDFRLVPMTEENLDDSGIIYDVESPEKFLLQSYKTGKTFIKDLEIIILNRPAYGANNVPCDTFAEIFYFDRFTLKKLGGFDYDYTCCLSYFSNDQHHKYTYNIEWKIEPKKRYFPEASDDEYLLFIPFWSTDGNIARKSGGYITGKIVKSKRFPEFNQVFTFIADDGTEFDIAFRLINNYFYNGHVDLKEDFPLRIDLFNDDLSDKNAPPDLQYDKVSCNIV